MNNTLLKVSLVAMFGLASFDSDHFMNVIAMEEGSKISQGTIGTQRDYLEELGAMHDQIRDFFKNKTPIRWNGKEISTTEDFSDTIRKNGGLPVLLMDFVASNQFQEINKYEFGKFLKDLKLQNYVENFKMPDYDLEWHILAGNREAFTYDQSAVRSEEFNESLLEYAAYIGNTEIFKYLVIKNVKITDSVIREAIKGGCVEIIRMIQCMTKPDFAKYIEFAVNRDVAVWIYKQFSPEIDSSVLKKLVKKGGYSAALALFNELDEQEQINLKPELMEIYVDNEAPTPFVDALLEKGNMEISKDLKVRAAIYYAKFGDLDKLKYLIKEHKVHPEEGRNSTTILQQACSHGRLDIVQYLISECKLDPNEKKTVFTTWSTFPTSHIQEGVPIRIAAEHGHWEIVKYLVQNGAKVNVGHILPIEEAARQGDLPMVDWLSEKGSPIGKSHLYAAESGHMEIVKHLMENEDTYKISKVTFDSGLGMIGCAYLSGNMELIKYLTETLKVRLTRYDKELILFEACKKGDLGNLKYFAETHDTKFDADITDYNGKSPLWYACVNGNLNVIRYLIETLKTKVNFKPSELMEARGTLKEYRTNKTKDEVVVFLKKLLKPKKSRVKSE